MSSPYTTLGLPPDAVAWTALGVACALLPGLCAPVRRAIAERVRPNLLVPALAVCAALLSIGYVTYYLRGGPRIIDATSYYLQARAMAHGYFAFPVLAPLGSFNGRFLLARAPRSLAVIFPPGYAGVLSLGFLLHAPMLVGPLLAALIVVATYALGRRLAGSGVGCVAAVLSVLCAALRYHTADTMSHGLCALLLAAGAYGALGSGRVSALLSGVAMGWLSATRPVSGVVGVALALCLIARSTRRSAWFALGVAPGVCFLLLYQHAATGSYASSTQLAYYALADGPPGCFRYGFGTQIGCLHEHGDYVRARLAAGYGLREAALVTVRRLALHSVDIANAPPLALLCLLGAWLARADRRVRCIFSACLGLMLAYAPFYFDASYPGGGARLFADLLPLEHVLLAIGLVRTRWTAFALPCSLLGFACYTSFAHRALSEREAGRPMFEARELERAGVRHGLVFVDTDHGFALGHDPGQFDAQQAVVVARARHDAHDYALWLELGKPASFRYSYAPAAAHGRAEVVPFAPDPSFRFEAEAEWPPLALHAAWSEPDFTPCASGGAGLRLHSTREAGPASVDFELPVEPGRRRIVLGWVRESGAATQLVIRSKLLPELALESSPVPTAGHLSAWAAPGAAGCVDVDFGEVELSRGPGRFRLESSRPGSFDYIELQAVPAGRDH